MNCIFCKIVRGEISCEKVYEDEHVFAFLDIAPINPGHTLVVPKKHFDTVVQTPHDVTCKCMDAIKMLAPAVMKGVGAEGFNIGLNNGSVAGQVIVHTHFHIIPRFPNDGHKHWSSKKYVEGQAEEVRKRIVSSL